MRSISTHEGEVHAGVARRGLVHHLLVHHLVLLIVARKLNMYVKKYVLVHHLQAVPLVHQMMPVNVLQVTNILVNVRISTCVMIVSC